jgi:hypothetical protein
MLKQRYSPDVSRGAGTHRKDLLACEADANYSILAILDPVSPNRLDKTKREPTLAFQSIFAYSFLIFLSLSYNSSSFP